MKEMIKLMDNLYNTNRVVKGMCSNFFLQVIKIIDLLHVIGSLCEETVGSLSGDEQ